MSEPSPLSPPSVDIIVDKVLGALCIVMYRYQCCLVKYDPYKFDFSLCQHDSKLVQVLFLFIDVFYEFFFNHTMFDKAFP